MLKIIRLNYMKRRPLYSCKHPKCYKPAVAIINEVGASPYQYIMCAEHLEELLNKIEQIKEEVPVEIYIYVKIQHDELEKMKTLIKHYPNLNRIV